MIQCFQISIILITFVFGGGCGSTSTEVLRARIDTCERVNQQISDEHRSLSEARIAALKRTSEAEVIQQKLEAQRSELSQRLKDASARERSLQVRLLSYQKILKTYVKRFSITLKRLRGGHILGLHLNQPLSGKFATHLVPIADEEGLELAPSATLTLDKWPVSSLKVQLSEAGHLQEVEITASGKGIAQVRAMTARVRAVCGRETEWLRGRPGPGTPQRDDLTGEKIPLIRLSKIGCEVSNKRSNLNISVTHARNGQGQNGQGLNNITVYVLLSAPHP